MGQKRGGRGSVGNDDLNQRLQEAVAAEVERLAAWSKQGTKPHTLGEMEQAVLAALRRLGPELMSGLIEQEAETASLSPPVRLWPADEGAPGATQAAADPDR